MKKISCFLLTVFIFFTSCQSQSRKDLIEKNSILDSNAVIVPGSDQVLITKLTSQILQNYHYRKNKINDSLSVIIFKNYIESLDNNKMYFFKSDYDMFAKSSEMFDDLILNGNLDIPYKIFNVYKQRLNERIKDIRKILSKEFDYTTKETIIIDREKEKWAENEAEMYDLWEKRIKNDALNIKLANKDWPKIRETLLKRYESYRHIILRYNEEDVFQLFLNAFSTATDPHTNYFSPKTSEDFKINMSLSLEGIGATLRFIDDYTTIVELVPGGPAFKSGKINPNDKIVSVGQGDDGEMVDVVGWKTDDVVLLIRGEKGTKVRLELLPADSRPDMPTKLVSLVREKVKLEEQAASKEIININESGKNYKLGVIKIPGFYSDFEAKGSGDKEFRSTTRDVKKLLGELQKEGIDGIIIDLRNNGGGALSEAIDLTGLFIEKGPVVQVKNSDGSIEIGEDTDPSLVYNGPLAVLVNKFSASASEIFSGAIQDYGRGVIIGNTTFGKGTVQNLVDLQRFIRNPQNKIGQLKLTIAKYYRVNGSSTQHKGVSPDVKFPDILSDEEYGESASPSALPWDQIGTTNFKKFSDISKYIPELNKKHNNRIKNNPEFKFLLEDIDEYKKLKLKNEYSLNETDRKLERDKSEAKQKIRETERFNYAKIEKPANKEVKIKNLFIDDPLLEESGHILANFVEFVKK